jgi:5-methylcytosine-specific restriction endonuclease McrA
MAHNKKYDKRAELILQIVNTDSSFIKSKDGSFIGPCIHCNKKFHVSPEGKSIITIEHIVPTGQGGTDDLENLALACKNCNNEKGRRHDQRSNMRSKEVIEKLLRKRKDLFKIKSV